MHEEHLAVLVVYQMVLLVLQHIIILEVAAELVGLVEMEFLHHKLVVLVA